MINPKIILALVALCAETSALITYKIPITNEIKQALGYTEGSYLNYTEWTSSFGYTSEQHSVTTEDGYILTFFRTTSPNCTQLKTYPALFLHGVLLNSDSYLEAGVNTSLVYLLADQCYDVWVANMRGNEYARAHTTLDPDTDAAFWRYSADESGYYDVPATVDYILNATGAAKLNLIGYSLGGQVVVVMCADRPEYNDKVNLFVGIASPTRNINIKPNLFTLLIRLFNSFGWLLQTFGIEEVIFKRSLLEVVVEYICQYNSALAPVFLGILGSYPRDVTSLTAQSVFSHFFVGASVQQLAKVGQDSLNDEFRHYDYGALGNMAKYGTLKAPVFNLDNVVVPTLLLTGLSDPAVASEDVHWLGQQLPNTLAVVELSDPQWEHFANIYSKNIPSILYPTIKQYLDLYN